MAASSIFVSPGVYTSEKDLTFVTRQVGVTTLGLVGETPKGPAFQPIFITNYDEFKRYFGGLDNTRFKGTNYPKYELNYIAKSYLTQSNQLFITRILGLSGYDAGDAWAITLDAALDTSTVGQTGTITHTSGFATYSATTGGTLTDINFADSILQSLYDDNKLDSVLSTLGSLSTGDTVSLTTTKYVKNGTTFSGATFEMEIINKGTSGSVITGETSGVTTTYSGTSYSDVEDRVVSLLRSRGSYDGNEILTFDVTGTTIAFDTSVDSAEEDPYAMFVLTGTTTGGDTFRYELSFDNTKKNYITRVLGRNNEDKKSSVFVEELYDSMLDTYNDDSKVRGLNLSLVHIDDLTDYKEAYQSSVTPYVLSELRGNKLLRLFRIWTITDGNTANEEIKVSIQNIKPDDKTFDIVVRSFNDTDASPSVLEKFASCTMEITSNNFVGRKVGTFDGEYESKSSYIMIEFPDEIVEDGFPAGFEGYPIRDYGTANAPIISYKTSYGTFEKKRKFYLGISDTVGIDQDLFDYKGKPGTTDFTVWTGRTNGFHLDVSASAATIEGVSIVINDAGDTYSPVFEFDTGAAEFRTDSGIDGTVYEKIVARKFTFVPYGGYDGWDIYRDSRTNTDTYKINGTKGALGLTAGVFSNRTTTNNESGINSDYYAYFEGIRTFANPESVNINVFATPGIDTFNNSDLIEESIEMVEEERADSFYIVTTPDVDNGGTALTGEDVVDTLDGIYDSNYTATYWPWLQMRDTENNVLVWLPPTLEVVRNAALTDNVAFPWYAIAGVNRGTTNAVKSRVKLTLEDRDTLYEGRVNPMATFSDTGVVIWGNKTLQVKDTALNRINVRRLLLQARKLISAVSVRLLFEQNDDVVRNQFLSLVNPILDNIRKERGLTDFRVQLSDDPEEIDRNELRGKIYIKPTRALEFIEVEFNITPTGASFENV